MQQLSNVLPDFSHVIPDRFKPYAKFVVTIVLGVVPIAVAQGFVGDGTAAQIITYVSIAATALGVLGTANVPEAEQEYIDATGREIALEVDE